MLHYDDITIIKLLIHTIFIPNSYIEVEGVKSLRDLHGKYVKYCKLPTSRTTQHGARIMTCRSFYKYFATLYPDHRLTRVMEDCCDTCIRIKEDLDSPHVSAADKEILKAYQFKHIADSMSMRTVMRDVIERFAGCKLTDTLSILSDEALLSAKFQVVKAF